MTRRSADGDPRQSIAVRTRSDLKQRLERVAEENGHSLGQEVERRLEASFEVASASKLERYIQNRPGLSYMIGLVTPLELTNQLGDVLQGVVRHAEDVGWSELHTREALAAAWDVVGYYYFWRGVDGVPVPDVRPTPPADAKVRDLPPALAGYCIAEQKLLASVALQDQATFQNTLDGKVANAWSGDGKRVESLKSDEGTVSPRRRAKQEAVGSEVSPEELERFKPIPPTWFQVLTERDAKRQTAKPPE
ncbi:hypothetical protein MKK75_12895 [Methylobacterium sp. J-030]|uniref:hypothetical protein n=1 Tax=Methylobacterium sp. J-030 TaxID=2836627 RepID=UPI001FBB76C1|nr:hypothetical protein [Methylobacterium sp. J-030]MCJ2069675.1 hypothetical protein [Methylobacterium sp. J-030]